MPRFQLPGPVATTRRLPAVSPPSMATAAALSLALLVAMIAGATGLFADDAKQASQETTPKTAVKELARIRDFSDWVTTLAYAPGGDTLAAASYEAVKLLDPSRKKVIATLGVDTGFVKALAYSPDGKHLAAGSYQTVTIWDVPTRKQVAELDGHRGYVTGVSYSPDGGQLATSSEDETIRIWNVPDGTLQRVVEGHSEPVQAVAFSPDGSLLASAGGDETRVTRPGVVKVWDSAGEEVKWTSNEHKRAATDVAFSPDGRFLVSASFDETLNVYDVADGKLVRSFTGHSRPTNSIAVVPAGRFVASASGGRAQGGNEVKIWSLESGEERASLEAHESKVTAVALSPDGHTLATSSHDKTVALWDVSPLLAAAGDKLHTADSDDKAAGEERQKTSAKQAKPSGQGEQPAVAADSNKPLRAGIIGLDTSHVIAFARTLNDADAKPDVADCRVVAAYPHGSPDIESSRSRIPMYTEQVRDEFDVEIVDSIDELLERVDVVLLETNDGRPHWEQALSVLKAGKPIFIDKPIAGSLTDAVAIFEAARHYQVPVFSSSSLRYASGAQSLRNGKIGEIVGCDAYSPCALEPTHPDLFWYGIHGVETLFTVMGSGCQTVTRVSTPDMDVVVGEWKGGRIGTFRGMRTGSRGYGGTAFGTKSTSPIGDYEGHRPLVVEIVNFFRTGEPPVSERETLEIYAFMEAADESKRIGGIPVTLESVLDKARKEARNKWMK